MLKELVENPRMFFEYYFSQFNHNFKDLNKYEREQMLNNDIDEIVKQLHKYRPAPRLQEKVNPRLDWMRPPFT
jgi:hypothetical protein